MSGETQGVLALQPDHERVLIPLTDEQIREYFRYTREEILKGMSPAGSVRVQRAGTFQADAIIRFEREGYGGEFEVLADETPRGGKVCISNLATKAMGVALMARGELHESTDWRVYRAKIAKELEKHRHQLKQMGVPGSVSNVPDGKLVTWERYIEVYGVD